MTDMKASMNLLGHTALVDVDNTYILNQRVGRITVRRPELLDFLYLYYYSNSPSYIGHLRSVAHSGVQVNLSTGQIKASPIFFPPLETQRKIAAILSAYDDLIENNTRRINLLEQAAHNLYREWFVEFRFPGHEAVPLVDSGTDYGMIPQGWEVLPVGNVFEFHIGGGWGKPEPAEKYKIPAYVVRGTDIPGARYANISDCPLRFHTESNLKSRRLQTGDIVFEVSGGSKGQPVGRALLVSDYLLRSFPEPVICASFCKLLRLNGIVTPVYFYIFLQELYESGEIEKYQVQSTGIINFKFAHFLDGAPVLVPSTNVQSHFSDFVQPMFDEIQVLGTCNNILRKTRDLLLPRLVSGEVDVNELEIEPREN